MRLEILDEKNNKIVKSFTKDKILIGRSKEADLILEGEGISRKHLYLETNKGQFFVTDLGSANGVYVNEEKMESNSRMQIQTFFPVRIGARTTISILTEEDESGITPLNTGGFFKEPSGSSNTTTRTLDKSSGFSAKNGKKDKAEKKTSSLTIFALMAVLGFGGYFIYVNFIDEGGTPNPEAATQQLADTGQEKKKPVIYEQLNFALKDALYTLQEMYKKDLCKSGLENAICTEYSLSPDNGEGAVMDEKGNLYVYGDFKKIFEKKNAEEIKTLKDRATEVLMANVALKVFSMPDIEKNVEKISIVNVAHKGDNDYILEEVRTFKTRLQKLDNSIKFDFLKQATSSPELQTFLASHSFFSFSTFGKVEEIP